MKRIFLLCLISIQTASVWAQHTKRVYFIGNSYTAVNNLPLLIKSCAASTENILHYEAHTPGGSNFQQHATNTQVLAKINEGNWDYVVLQQQSQMPAFPLSHVQNNTYNYASQLSSAIKTANVCGTPLFYMTWGYKNGDASNCSGLPYICTYEGMDDKIYERYMQMALDNEAVISPVGRVWRTIRAQYPDYELYQSDNSHPSLLGSMAAAYTFYTVIFKKDPTLITYDGGLNPEVATNLKAVAKAVVYDQLEFWKSGINDIASRFSYEIQNNTVQFTNQNPTTTDFLWDFGDGQTSVLPDPVHTYNQNGHYTVSLTTDACQTISTRIQELDITSLGISDQQSEEIKVYPNPTTGLVFIKGTTIEDITLSNLIGKKLKIPTSITETGIVLDISNYPKGVYFVTLKTPERNSIKIIKY